MVSSGNEREWQEPFGLRPVRVRPRNAWVSSLMGYVVSLVVGLGALKFVTLVFALLESLPWSSGTSVWAQGFAWSQLGCIPFGMGLIAAHFWIDEREIARAANDRPFDLNGSVLLNTILASAGAFYTSVEVVPLLILAAPLICFSMWLGTRTGNRWWRQIESRGS